MRNVSTSFIAKFTAGVLAVMISATVHAHPCTPGDLDHSGTIDTADLLTLLGLWGSCPAEPELCPADLDENGSVGTGDLLLLLANWGPGPFTPGTFPDAWISGGLDCGTEPEIQIHQYNDNTFILRQSLCTSFEAPFLYLLFGTDEVLLIDTGDGGIALADTVYTIIDDWLALNNQPSIDLIVAHSHSHGDHIAGDPQFEGQPDTTLIGHTFGEIWGFWGFTDWPNDIVQYDLGGRMLDVMATPEHHPNHIGIYDRETGLFLSGDTLYPGRLYISNFNQYVDSIERVVAFTDVNDVCDFVGGHIEMSNTPGQDFAFGSTHHPDEHPLPLHREHLLELRDAVLKMQASPHIEVHDEFIIWPF